MSQALFDEAVRLEETGQYEGALRLWRQLAENEPTRNVFLRLANIANELGLIDDAERAFKQALEIDERSAVALIGLGSLAIDRRDYVSAQRYLKCACEIDGTAGAFTMLGVALRNSGKDIEAEQAYRSALRIDPKYEEAFYNLGVLFRESNPSEAQALFRAALELDPGYACAYRELGYVLSRHGAETEAESHLRKAIELDPADAWAHIYLGTCLWQSADVDGATAEFRIAANLQPEWAVPLWSLGNIYEYAVEDFDLAQGYFERALNVEPDSDVALQGLNRLRKKRLLSE